MASNPATPAPRRSSSLPVGRLTSSSPDPQIEILFTLPSVRIISFTTSSRPSSRPGSSNGSMLVEEEPGTLSWVSRFERTIAVGPLRIYRAPGSVAFLSCANALRPILPKSQAWCVDGNSKFVLQIRPPQYWRIEVPNKTSDENVMVEELKKVFEQVLRYEKTACPFQRDFVVKLPEKPATPIKKRPWRPVERPQGDESPKSSPLLQATTPDENQVVVAMPESRPSTPCPTPVICAPAGRPTSPPTPHRDPESPAPKSVSGIRQAIEAVEISNPSGIATPEPLEHRTELEPTSLRALQPSLLDTPESEYIFGSYAGTDEESDSFSDATDDTNLTPRSGVQSQVQPLANESDKASKPESIQNCNPSVTVPPLLSLVASSPSKQRTASPLRCSTSFETSSDCSSSVESFHSVQSWHSPLAPPSPPASEPSSPTSTYPYPHENIVLPKRHLHTRDISEITVTPEEPNIWERNSATSIRSTNSSLSPPPRTPPTLVHDGSEKSDEEHSEIVTPPTVRPTVRHRATTSSNSRRRALSPLPAAVNLFSPPKRAQRRLRTARHLPTAIIQKTCEILLSPPSHLFQLMLSIASKIAAGEWRGMLSGHGEAVHWDFEDEYGADAIYEDDYCMSLVKTKKQPTAKISGSSVTGGSWEVD
ncbi:inheritance of peroxisomes protein 1-domain-containing protein [Rhexocercosporidium sp. MPI-PUGE-AT-0058]|nr:inheritance of peroxisomes protein 1-domain-containing protein [Rhexocercosporidium sp. MPI-PUGE-AT-0058]